MYIALSFVCLRYEQIRYMPPNSVLIADGVATKYLLQSANCALAFTDTKATICVLHSGVYQCTIAILPLDH